MTRDRDVIRAEKLRVIVESPEYRETIGAWLTEAYEQALYKMKSAGPEEFQRAQGYFSAIEELQATIAATFEAEKRAIAKMSKKTTEDDNGE